MLEEVARHLYRIEVPLPRHPMKSTNSYAVVARPRNLVIDTATRTAEGLACLLNRLAELDIDLSRTDFFITHYHSDHFGLIPELIVNGIRVFMSGTEIDRLRSGPFWEALIAYAQSWGYSAEDSKSLRQAFQGTYRFDPSLGLETTEVREGETLSYDGYTFSCILTPGHTPGHMCLHEPEQGLLVCGDHLLPNVVPFIQVWSDAGNPLKDHFESLARAVELQPKQVLPGHGRVFRNAPARVEQITRWHQKRAEKILATVSKEPMTPVKAAAHIRSKTAPVIEDPFVRAFHRFIEVAETMAYLRYLERDNLIQQREVNGALTFGPR